MAYITASTYGAKAHVCASADRLDHIEVVIGETSTVGLSLDEAEALAKRLLEVVAQLRAVQTGEVAA